jgi:hypothetical protein
MGHFIAVGVCGYLISFAEGKEIALLREAQAEVEALLLRIQARVDAIKREAPKADDDRLNRSLKPDTDTNFDNLKRIVAGVRKAESVVVYEGLPHQLWEAEELREEIRQKKTVQLHRFPFYDTPLTLKEFGARWLTELACGPVAFEKWGGFKLCGEFHLDWCVEWRAGKDTYRALICFGCGEAKLYGPGVELYCDLRREAVKPLKDFFSGKGNNRPSGP